MSEESSGELREVSKAVQAASKTTSDAIGIVANTGNFLNRAFGGLVEDSVGIVADRIKFYRLNNYISLCDKTAEKMREKGISEDTTTKIVPIKIAMPLIEHATMEDNVSLQDYWAHLLANAMDPNFESNVERRHVSLLSEMEPLDLRILNTICLQYQSELKQGTLEDILFEKSKIKDKLNVQDQLIEVALLNLMRLGCIKLGNIRSTSFFVQGEANTIYMGTERFHLSLLGLGLFQAAMTS